MSVEIEDGLKIWLRKKKLSALEMENLYELVIENCSRIPKVQLTAKLWNERGEKVSKGNDSYANNAITENKQKSWQSIIDELKRIRNKQDRCDLTGKEIDMLHEFSDLMDVYRMLEQVPTLIMPQRDKDTYMRKVLESILINEPVNMEAVRRHMRRRYAEYNDKYGAEAEEQISRTVDDLHNVFAENAKLLKPEPDRIFG